ncbi:MAG: chloride channel protein [SAR324 cluster bacterium]|nr:chloride channel protein [SAR324 cluster bacterium]
MINFKKIWRRQLNKFLSRGFVDSEADLLSRFQAVSAREAVVMMMAALGIGLVCGILAVSLNWSVHTLRLFIAGLDLGWRSIFFPALGAGIAVFFVRYLMHDNEGHGVSSVIKAIAMGSGTLRRRMIYSRFFGSFLTVGSGGSTGLEGPIVSIGGAMGSTLGRWLDMNERHKKLLVGYGAAGAVAGIFNAPLTGLIFSLEIIIGEWTYLTILPTIIAAVSATEVSRWIMGNKIAFYQEIAGFSITSLIACFALGALTGVISILFVRSLHIWEKFFAKISLHLWVRAAIGGLSVGVLGYYMPEVLSEGYSVTQSFLTDSIRPELGFILLFVLLKFLACGLTLGSGGVGGVFAPSLVIGSGVGLAFGMILHLLPLDGVAEDAAFALAGMAGMVAGVMHGPLTGIFLVMEATRGYSMILPLMLTASSAMVVSSFFEIGSVYTQDLIKQGSLIKRGTDRYLLHHLNIRDILDKDFITIPEGLLLRDFIDEFKRARRNYFPVLDAEEQCVGVVFLDDIRPHLFDTSLYDLVTMGSVMRNLPIINLNEPINVALDKFETSKAWSLPVVEGKIFLGMLSKSTLFDHYRRELQIQAI